MGHSRGLISCIAAIVTEIRDWLGVKVNFRAIHNDVKRKRAKGTGDWFVNSPKYQEWKAEKGSVLCGKGIGECCTLYAAASANGSI
jgi:hypothetical protein